MRAKISFNQLFGLSLRNESKKNFIKKKKPY